MIKGKAMKEMFSIKKKELDYRALGALNYSMVRLFDTDPVRFFEQFKLGWKRKNKTTASLVMGDVVDFYILDCRGDESEFDHRYDEKFALFDGTVKKTSQSIMLADVLFDITQDNLNQDGEVMLSFGTRFKEALQKMQALGKFGGKDEEKALEEFNKNGLAYFEARLDNIGKTIVDHSIIEKSKQIAKSILADSFTKEVFEDGEDVEYFPKFPIEWVYVSKDGRKIECKSEIDILKINHQEKKIYLKDLKTTYDNENFEYSYLKHGYYLQAGFYYMAVKYFAEQEDMEDYHIVPMEFIVGDTSSNNRRPIKYKTSLKDLQMSLTGFSIRGTEYKGVNQIIEEINWAEDNDIWNCSREVFENEGKIKIKLEYGV